VDDESESKSGKTASAKPKSNLATKSSTSSSNPVP
jgi:hypothetical protein